MKFKNDTAVHDRIMLCHFLDICKYYKNDLDDLRLFAKEISKKFL